MAFSSYYYSTQLPPSITQEIIHSCESYISPTQKSTINHKYSNNFQDLAIRSSYTKWISCESWIAAFIFYYIKKVNDHNFLYDINDFDSQLLQYTTYTTNDFYHWHVDNNIQSESVQSIPIINSAKLTNPKDFVSNSNHVRKLSFSLILSPPSDYTGGVLQFHDYKSSWTIDNSLGTLVVFDSTLPHRVTKVTSGIRKSLVGWVLGPRWK